MDKKRLTKILTKADSGIIETLASKYKEHCDILVIREPSKTLAMIKMREPVKESLFYIGEVIVCEAAVELDGVKGVAVTMGDDFEKTFNMAVIDAAYNKGLFYDEAVLLELERSYTLLEERENAMHLKTMVNFNSLDQEVAK
jgi:alpha-D-ribose 1-methylphosphonate 5-triphosphate synthase subunit PhnG